MHSIPGITRSLSLVSGNCCFISFCIQFQAVRRHTIYLAVSCLGGPASVFCLSFIVANFKRREKRHSPKGLELVVCPIYIDG